MVDDDEVDTEYNMEYDTFLELQRTRLIQLPPATIHFLESLMDMINSDQIRNMDTEDMIKFSGSGFLLILNIKSWFLTNDNN